MICGIMTTIADIERIGITPDKIILLPKVGISREYNRSDYNLYVDNVRQVQDESPAIERRTAILLKSTVSCFINEKEKAIFCGPYSSSMKKVS